MDAVRALVAGGLKSDVRVVLRGGTYPLAAPLVFLALLGGKISAKILGLLPAVGVFHKARNERWYYTLLMSTGLTFGTISALFGLTHGIVSAEQYSHLVAVVIASAVVPTRTFENAWKS